MTETRVMTEDLRAAIERSGYYPGLVTDAVASALGPERPLALSAGSIRPRAQAGASASVLRPASPAGSTASPAGSGAGRSIRTSAHAPIATATTASISR